MRVEITLTVNGDPYSVHVEPNRTLLDVLRDDLGLTGTNRGCNQGDCGACTVLVDGKAMNACLVLAPDADGAQITTIEGLATGGRLHPIQQAFIDEGAVQCGYCTPGMIMTAAALLAAHPDPTEEQIRNGIEGNLCRCTGYESIVRAVRAAGRKP
ncbi:MAG: (2Fe-2S)-binding protein [Deltaproteobacteria bacterium]|nr:(2Fe-2S)-binding protein [Deltaproteobacteria bacterium]